LRIAGGDASARGNMRRHLGEQARAVDRCGVNAPPQAAHAFAWRGFAWLGRLGLHLSEQVDPAKPANLTK